MNAHDRRKCHQGQPGPANFLHLSRRRPFWVMKTARRCAPAEEPVEANTVSHEKRQQESRRYPYTEACKRPSLRKPWGTRTLCECSVIHMDPYALARRRPGQHLQRNQKNPAPSPNLHEENIETGLQKSIGARLPALLPTAQRARAPAADGPRRADDIQWTRMPTTPAGDSDLRAGSTRLSAEITCWELLTTATIAKKTACSPLITSMSHVHTEMISKSILDFRCTVNVVDGCQCQ